MDSQPTADALVLIFIFQDIKDDMQ